MDEKKIPGRLRLAIKRNDMTIASTAQAAGLSRPQVQLYATGRRVPTVQSAAALAAALNVSVDWLLGRSDEAQDYVDEIRRVAIGLEPENRRLLLAMTRAMRDAQDRKGGERP